MRCEEVLLAVHDRIEALLREIGGQVAGTSEGTALLDVGCWDGGTTLRFARAFGASRVAGVEIFPGPLAEALARGIEAHRVDLERDPLPFGDGEFDVVICNQVFEHLKQIYRPLGEIHRVLRAEGRLVFSVPNLGSLHNRLLLLLGEQPTSIRIIGPHVRGFAHRPLRRFLTVGGRFSVDRREGVGFYPLPVRTGANVLARLLPGLAHTSLFVLRKLKGRGPTWEELVEAGEYQTAFEETGG